MKNKRIGFGDLFILSFMFVLVCLCMVLGFFLEKFINPVVDGTSQNGSHEQIESNWGFDYSDDDDHSFYEYDDNYSWQDSWSYSDDGAEEDYSWDYSDSGSWDDSWDYSDSGSWDYYDSWGDDYYSDSGSWDSYYSDDYSWGEDSYSDSGAW